MNTFIKILLISAILNLDFVTCIETPVLLKISEKSEIIGIEDTTVGANSRKFYSFRGIPYADQSRWTDPKLKVLTAPMYDATKYGEVCPQWSFATKGMVGNEDCLFLNVFMPKLHNETDVNKLLPVMVYIHGGGYVVGSSNLAGPKIFMNHDIVLVTLNYRLGVFGYLSNGQSSLPGNYGALDQIVALEWVQKYIQKFGGDPNSVTIFGHSAGGAAVHMLTLSPRAKGKYHKAIIQSGTAFCHWALNRNPEANIRKFAEKVDCSSDHSYKIVECLKTLTTTELLEAQTASFDFWILPITSTHVVDGESRGGGAAFLPDYPENLMDKGLFHKVPTMAGIVTDEGLIAYPSLHLTVGKKNFKDKSYFKKEIIPRIVRSVLPTDEFNSGDIDRVSKEVLKAYFPKEGADSEKAKIYHVAEIFGDSMFNYGQWDLLKKYSAQGAKNIYSYVFTHRTPKSPFVMWKQVKELQAQEVDHPLFDSAVAHVDDMYYLFQPCEQLPSDPNHKMSSEDLEFAHYLTGLWVAFARTGDPNEGIKNFHDQEFKAWKPLGSGGAINYYNLTSIPANMGTGFREKECKFWKRVYDSLEENEGRKRKVDEL